MARTANKAKEEIELPAIDEQGINDAMNTMTTIQSEYNEERDLVNQLLGQAQMADAFGKFSQTVWASKLNFVKENKLYRNLSGKKTPNGLELKGTWEEFCSLLGVSDEKANQDIANLKSFGEEALESMSRMGIGYRELRQYRKLPEDQKTALIEVAKAGDKEALVELAEEFIAKNAKEKEVLQKENEELKKEYKALDAVNATNKNSIDDLKLKLSKYDLKIIPIEEQIKDLGLVVDLNENINKPITRALNELDAVINHLHQLELNAMENDPDFQPGDLLILPDIMLKELIKYDGFIVLLLEHVKRIHRDFCNKFDANIEEYRSRMDEAKYDNLSDNN
ncbi:hypothetical protein [Gilliamella sp. Pas-s27]|uniref:hypothetical protein n=1 Tax=Gilliamella sp. Pas-s27 TaxID=2687311 RepID=UPI001924435F|nr:hypothetical protein [Gilliamella sp. Pas-s27]